MTIAEIFVTVGGIALIVVILWYFFWSGDEPVRSTAPERDVEE